MRVFRAMLVLLAGAAQAREGGVPSNPLRDALEHSVETAKRQVDRPAPAPAPCFGGLVGPQVAVEIGGMSGQVPVQFAPSQRARGAQFWFRFPEMAARDPMQGNLSVQVSADHGGGVFDPETHALRYPDVSPVAQGVRLADGRLDLGGGVSLLRGPDGAVMAVFHCTPSQCSQRWVTGGLDIVAEFDAAQLADWPRVEQKVSGFLTCAFPAAFAPLHGGKPAQNR